MAMNRALFRKELQEGLNAVFGLEYDRYEEQWTKIFEVKTSGKAYEEQVIRSGLGGGAVKAEGAAVQYDQGAEGWTARYMHVTVALAFAITEEAREDNLYGDLGADYSRSMARGMKFTKEVRGANVLNNGFDTNYLGGDGVVLFSTAHPLMGGGTFSNRPSTAADVSEASLEDASIEIAGFVDERGIPVMVKPKRLIISRQQKYVVHRILKSNGQVDTADNNANALKDLAVIDEVAVNLYLQDPDAWFIITDCPKGLQHFKRKSISRGIEGDFETGNMRYKSRERYSNGWTDPRGAYGSPGAD
jgi:hypothetical protein